MKTELSDIDMSDAEENEGAGDLQKGIIGALNSPKVTLIKEKLIMPCFNEWINPDCKRPSRKENSRHWSWWIRL